MKELIKALKQIAGSKILQVEPLCFQYKDIEFEISLDDNEDQIYIISCVVYQNKEMSYDDVTKYMAAFIATEGIRYSSCLEYDLSLNQANKTYKFVLYGELSFHFSNLIENPSGFLSEMILEDMIGKKEQFQQKLELAQS